MTRQPGRAAIRIRQGLAAFSLAVLLAAGGCAAGQRYPNSPRTMTLDLIAVPDVRQSTDFSCGASALQAVLAYYGDDRREDYLMEILGTDEENGTTPESIVRVATELGLRASIGENLTLDELRAALDIRVPVIVALQTWVDAKPRGFSWAETWDEGHYAVVIGMDADYVYLEDPSLLASRGRIPVRESAERWHDEAYSGESPLDSRGRRWVHLGILVRPGEAGRRNLPAFTDME